MTTKKTDLTRHQQQHRKREEQKRSQAPPSVVPAKSLRVYREGHRVVVLAEHPQVALLLPMNAQQAAMLSAKILELASEAKLAEPEPGEGRGGEMPSVAFQKARQLGWTQVHDPEWPAPEPEEEGEPEA